MCQVSPPRRSLILGFALILGLGSSLLAQDAPKKIEMKPYTESIAGSDLKFEMLPIPGGTYTLGSPASESKRKPDEGPQVTVQIAPFGIRQRGCINILRAQKLPGIRGPVLRSRS